MIRGLRNILRLVGIAWTLARHDALFPLELIQIAPPLTFIARLMARRRSSRRPGERLARALLDLGPSFVKLGQSLATRSDLLGEDVTGDLSRLQDRMPAFSGTVAKKIIESELGRTVDQLYESFESEPVAAASIAQVHRAVTPDGRLVAVKVLRPDVEAAFERDLDLFRWIADFVERTQPWLRRLKPRQVVETFAETVRSEMDLRLEAAAASELAENFRGDDTFRVPEIEWSLTGQRVLTLDWIDGVRIDQVETLRDAGHDVDRILAHAAGAMFNQVFRDGYFHADMHPGNMFVTADGTLVAVDFGIMGRLDQRTRNYLADMLLGFLTRNYRQVAEVHFQAGFVPAHKSPEAFAQACRSIGEPILGRPLHEISLARLLAQLFRITETFEMEAQPQLLLLQKTMLVAEGVGRRLNPDVNMWQMAQPLIEDWMRFNRGPEARAAAALNDALDSIARMPKLLSDIDTAMTALTGGGIRVHPDALKGLAGRGRPWTFWLGWGLAVALAAGWGLSVAL